MRKAGLVLSSSVQCAIGRHWQSFPWCDAVQEDHCCGHPTPHLQGGLDWEAEEGVKEWGEW